MSKTVMAHHKVPEIGRVVLRLESEKGLPDKFVLLKYAGNGLFLSRLSFSNLDLATEVFNANVRTLNKRHDRLLARREESYSMVYDALPTYGAF